MTCKEITGIIVDTAIQVHRALGPGLLESVYQAVLGYELAARGLKVEHEVGFPVVWKEVRLDVGFRADLVVEGRVIVELKACEAVLPVHKKQLLSYLRLADKRVGLLINFNELRLVDGITRLVNGVED